MIMCKQTYHFKTKNTRLNVADPMAYAPDNW